MKILHAMLFFSIPAGVERQLEEESICAKELLKEGVQWDTECISLAKISECKISWAPLKRISKNKFFIFIRLNYIFYKLLLCKNKKYDFILLRYRPGDFILPLSLMLLEGAMTFHHSLEIEEMKTRPKTAKLMFEIASEKLFGRYSRRKAFGIVGVTPEIAQKQALRSGCLDKPIFVLPNGMGVDRISLEPDKREEYPVFCIVASNFMPWHGLDLILEALSKSHEYWKLHVIGDASAHLRSLAKDSGSIFFHGKLNMHDILKIYSTSDVGLGSFGYFRSGLQQGSTLKVREYLAHGMAVMYGHEDPGLPDKLPFVMKCSFFDASRALDFAMRTKQFSRTMVRDKASPYINKIEIMRRFMGSLKKEIISSWKK